MVLGDPSAILGEKYVHIAKSIYSADLSATRGEGEKKMTANQIMETIRNEGVSKHIFYNYYGFLTCDEKYKIGEKINETKCTLIAPLWKGQEGDLWAIEYAIAKHINHYGHYTYIIADEYVGKHNLDEQQVILEEPVVIGIVYETEKDKHNTKKWYRTEDGRTIDINKNGRGIYTKPELD